MTRLMSRARLPQALLLTILLGGAAAAAPCSNPDALGTSRTLIVGTEGGTAVGLKTYPQTLPLADHEVVLTFDDGPFPATTGPILAALAKECVQATFFLVGRNAEANPVFVRREIAAGHTVGHHSFSHPDITLRGMSDSAARSEIDRGIAADERAANYPIAATGSPVPHVPFFRFPGFGDTPALRSWLADRRIAILGADLWASDWNVMTPEAELKLLLDRLEAKGRGIILLHDTKKHTADMLPAFLRQLKMRGYRVVALQPGPGPAETTPAPAGWTSETEASLQKIMPRLLAAAAHPRLVKARATPADRLRGLKLRTNNATGTSGGSDLPMH
jgi:peptidoglycan/xylan/chitin deacetylase (PgdA/CDA1 family)